jgi:uncharacterized membrane protein
MKGYVTVGLTLLAGAALLEAALIPGILIGGAAVLVPSYLPKLGRRRRPASSPKAQRQSEPAVSLTDRLGLTAPATGPAGLRITQAIAKTITFRMIVTTLDFTTNYVVIGEFAAAAGLSAFGLVAGPVFYLAHETAWNYFGPSGDTVDVPAFPPLRSGAKASLAGQGGFTISRALAKTITFRTIATVMDFTANYVVVGDLLTAAGLSAFAFVVGPFVYLGHEKAWDYYTSPKANAEVPLQLAHQASSA